MALVVALAVWWIGRTLVAPPAPNQSAAALLEGPDGAHPLGQDDRLPADAPDAAATRRARALVRQEPLAAGAYAVLALAAQKAGQDEKAARLMQIAAALWPRDLLVQSWLLQRSLRLGDRPAVVSRLDVIARGHPESLDAMTEVLAPILADPASQAAFADGLAADPPWRTRFIGIAVRLWRVPSGLIGLMDRLQARPPGLEPAELRPYLSKLLVTGRADQAYLSWLRSLPDQRRASLGFLYNGHFQYPVTDMPFDWQTPTVPGVRSVVAGPSGQRVLTIGFLGGQIERQPIQHDLLLAPGSYRLTGRVATDRLEAEQGVRWRIACLDDLDRAVASSDLFKGSSGWHDFSMDVTVPEASCGAQTLALEVYARYPGEQAASGIVSFAALDIQPR